MGCVHSVLEKKPLQNSFTKESFLRDLPYTNIHSKLERLKTVELLVLDNSIRETTVANTRGHTCEDKFKILDLVKDVGGINSAFVGTFGGLKRVDDVFSIKLKDILKTKSNPYKGMNFYTFCELRDKVNDGVPDHAITTGMSRAAEYCIPNIVIELDLACKAINWEIFTLDKYFSLLKSRITWIRRYCKSPISDENNETSNNESNRILINIRDFVTAWNTVPNRVIEFIELVSNLPNEEKLFGLVFEDPSGSVLPFQCGRLVQLTRHVMDSGGWTHGHLLVHVHQSFGLAEAIVLECLMNGATGIWCGICKEGAVSGHACSITTVVNLHRIGNIFVQKNYNLPKMHQAAVEITRLVTGKDPDPVTEIYGARALDICFDESMATNDDICSELFGRKKVIRISTLSTLDMIRDAMKMNFGEGEYDQHLISRMLEIIHEDLVESRKEDNSSAYGLMALYKRAGGEITSDMIKVVEKETNAFQSPLLRDVYTYATQSIGLSLEFDAPFSMGYSDFYECFLSRYVSSFESELSHKCIKVFDIIEDGQIDWDELKQRIIFALQQYPKECIHLDAVIDILFQKIIFPEARSLGAVNNFHVSKDCFTSSCVARKKLRKVMSMTGKVKGIQKQNTSKNARVYVADIDIMLKA